jgi:hypothetical protein
MEDMTWSWGVCTQQNLNFHVIDRVCANYCHQLFNKQPIATPPYFQHNLYQLHRSAQNIVR